MRPFPSYFAPLLLIAACGGGATVTGDPKTAEPASPAFKSDQARDRSDSEAEPRQSSASEKAESACDDGTCSRCGNGICPSGWYCDEKSNGCSWLSECAGKPSCACVTRVLGASCKCREDGGLKVTCD